MKVLSSYMKEEYTMKFVIKHEIRGRIRVPDPAGPHEH